MVATARPIVRVRAAQRRGHEFLRRRRRHAFASKGETLPDYIRQATAYLQNAVAGLLIGWTRR